MEKLIQRHNRPEQARRFNSSQVDCENIICACTQFLQIQKVQLIDLQESVERFCIVLSVFDFYSAKIDLNLIKLYLLPIHVNEQGIEPKLIKKANQLIRFKIGHFHSLDIIIFLVGGASLVWFQKAYKTSETKIFFSDEWVDHANKIQNTELPQNDAFYSKLHNSNLLETEYTIVLTYRKVD